MHSVVCIISMLYDSTSMITYKLWASYDIVTYLALVISYHKTDGMLRRVTELF